MKITLRDLIDKALKQIASKDYDGAQETLTTASETLDEGTDILQQILAQWTSVFD